MKCNEVRQHWNLYHDSEGEAGLHFQISEHLGVCPDCAEWFSKQSRLEDLLTEKLAPQPATTELWNEVLAKAGVMQPVRSRRWLWFASIAACLSLVVVAVTLYWSRPASPDLVKLSAANHQRLIDGSETPQFESGSDLEVEAYLRKRVSFPVRCPPRTDSGFEVKGAGVCNLAEHPAAYLSGRVNDSPVSIFILSRESLAAFPVQHDAIKKDKTHRTQEGDFAMVCGVIDRNVVLVIGRTDPTQLENVLKAYGTYPDHH